MSNDNFQPYCPPAAHDPDIWQEIGVESINHIGSIADSIHQGFAPHTYQALVKKLDLSGREFQQVTLIATSTVKRRLAKGERFTVQESDAMYRLAMLLKLATDLFEDEQRAIEWLREKVYGLGGRRPLDMVSTTFDFETVKNLIGQLEHGVFS